MPIIIVDGNFTDWSDWSNCSVTCGSGIRNRTRNCTNPAPRGTGKNCTGNRTEIEKCNTKDCPGEFNYNLIMIVFRINCAWLRNGS